MKKMIVCFFVIILFLPMLLGIVSGISGINVDSTLKGYTDSVSKPALTLNSFLSGSYQKQYSTYFEQELKPRGVLIKTYSSIQFDLFHQGNRIIGNNNDVFEMDYINSELCIGNGYNYATSSDNIERITDFVSRLDILQEKLARFGKSLLVCVAPSKANFHRSNIPSKYLEISAVDGINAIDCFSKYIHQSSIPHLIFREWKNNLDYPAFYSTGIHWSRTFEQMACVQIMQTLSKLSGRQYRTLDLQDVVESGEPFWRDADVFELLNTWEKPKERYYEYVEKTSEIEGSDCFGVIIQGTSFGDGIRRELNNIYPGGYVYYINRKSFYRKGAGPAIPITDYSDLDLNEYLDHVESIVIETTETNLPNNNIDFVNYLISFLDTYEPKSIGSHFASSLDPTTDDFWESGSIIDGIYHKESFGSWVQSKSRMVIEDENIRNEGLKIVMLIPSWIFDYDQNPDEITITINGQEVYEYTTYKEETLEIEIDPEKINQLYGDKYFIDIDTTKSFVPKEIGLNADTRDLAFQLRYLGVKR